MKTVIAKVQAALEKARGLLAGARKTAVAVAGVAASLLAAGLLPEPVASYVSAGLAFLATVGVYAVPNKQKAPAA